MLLSELLGSATRYLNLLYKQKNIETEIDKNDKSLIQLENCLI